MCLREAVEDFAMQISMSYEYYTKSSPMGCTYLRFAFQVAYMGIRKESVRGWICERLADMAVTMRISPSVVFCGREMDPFAYLRES